MIEANTTADRDKLLASFPKGSFGPESSCIAMDAKRPSTNQWLVTSGLSSRQSADSLLHLLQSKYPSVESVILLPTRTGSIYTTFKLQVTDDNERSRLISQGIFIDMCHYRVAPLAHRPRRCYHCHRIGHVGAACRSPKRCFNCGSSEPDHAIPCSLPLHCCNCSSPDHGANSVKCPVYLEALRQAESSGTP